MGDGSNDMPSRAVFISAIVPSNVIVASAVPLPIMNDRPAVPMVITPFVEVRVTRISLAPASTSLTEIRLPFPVENMSAVSSGVA